MPSFLRDYRLHIWKFNIFLVYFISECFVFVPCGNKIIYWELINMENSFGKLAIIGYNMGEFFFRLYRSSHQY